ncbi:MAG: RtcB family protein [Clostridia bacterium]|nr:RtcB family protein [Clostridia bacterium]
MIIIKSTYNEAKIFTDTLDSGSEGLIKAFCASPVSEGSKIRMMPDVHAGKGCVIGTTITVTDKIAPGLIGVDIGCGITAIKLSCKRMELQKLDKVIHEKIPAGKEIRSSAHRFSADIDLDALRCGKYIRKDKAYASIGTLGGGNHFIEIDRGEDGTYWLVIHSGSRYLGVQTAEFYHEEAFRASKDVPYELAYAMGDLMADYLHDLAIVQEFARLNRLAIADDICKNMKFSADETFECVHNYCDISSMILRKGAISAQKDEFVIIPMNMRDGCLIGRGKGNPDWNDSAPHGAGRLMSRQETRNSFTLSQYKKEMKGIYSSSVSRETLDESPMAYKPMESILTQIGDTVEITERIRPIYNFKAGDEI